MATLRDSVLPIINGGRSLVQSLGLRQHRIWVRVGSWSADEVHLGNLNVADVEIVPRPKCKHLGSSRLEVSKITPNHTTGGWEPDELLPALEAGQELYFVVRGPDGADVLFTLVEVIAVKNFTYTLILERLPKALPDFSG